MDVTYRTADGRLEFRFQAETDKVAFATVASIASIFELDSACGHCGSKAIVPEHRNAGGYEYYSLRCRDCLSQLDFGQLRDGGGLFPKRKDKDGRKLSDGGWHFWQKQEVAASSC